MSKEDPETDISNYFRSNLLTVRKAVCQEDFKRFAALSTNEQRVAFILSYPEARYLSLEVENQGGRDSEKALKLKDAGNKFFGHGEFKKALETYSNAVLLASKNELAVLLANRAATLYHLERYEHALEDADEALRVGYPKELYYKLEERRARCLLGMKRHADAVKAFRNSLTALDDAKVTGERKQKFEADIRLMLAIMEKGQKMQIKSKEILRTGGTRSTSGSTSSSVPCIENVNPLYPACSNSMEIKDNGGDMGRHAVATKDIAPGEILIVERPHCALLLAEYRLTHCHLCFSRIFVPIPPACYTCSCVAYCSVRCRNSDKKVHQRECNLLPALWLSKASITCFLALRAILQRPFQELVNFKKELSDGSGKFEISSQRPYKGYSYQTFYNLVTHEAERSTDDLFHRAYIASWLLRLLKTGNYFPENTKTLDSSEQPLSEEELLVAGLLLHNLQLLQFNSHEISELTVPKGDKTLVKAKSVFIGGGVYPTVALLNHSCNPGVVRYFIGTTMVIHAIRTIRKGEEISENYGPIFTTVPEAERKRKMRVQYWFDCTCEACTYHWPLLDDIDPTILRFKCETGLSCNNTLPVKTDTNQFMISCQKCGKNTNILKGLKALQDTDALLRTASRNLEEGQHEKALQSYLKILKILDETLALPLRDYHFCQQGIRLCMLTLGNTAAI